MISRRPAQLLALSLGLAVTLAACSTEEAELTTTSVVIADGGEDGTTTTAPVEPTEPPATTSTVLRGQSVEGWEVVGREPGDEGETLYIVIPPGAYTDVDLENFIYDLFESNIATYNAEVFDHAEAVDAFLTSEPERTEAAQKLVDEHHFVSLLEGAVIRFQGPFADKGELTIGS